MMSRIPVVIFFVTAILIAATPTLAQDQSDIKASIQSANDTEMKRVMAIFAQDADPHLSDKKFLLNAENVVRSTLKDPDSAKFDHTAVGKKDGFRYVCGNVNAKNSFGGYVGAAPFIATSKQVVVLVGEDSDPYYLDLLLAVGSAADYLRLANPAINYFC